MKMMKIKNIKTRASKIIPGLLLIGLILLNSSCDDFLDALPDNRITLDTPQKIRELMMTCYPTANYATIGEYSSDNFVDNRVGNLSGVAINAYDRMDNDLFAWRDIRGQDRDEDSPYNVWEQYYQSIAAANIILRSIEELEKRGITESMDAQKGEALILRAYAHFILVNIFAMPYKDPEASKNDMGITYMKLPETVVGSHYERNSVAEVYAEIEKDIEAGLPLIDDSSYDVPTYHFTSRAAHAFAAKFYLYMRKYEKVVEHADQVLGTGDPSSQLRDWATIYQNAEQQCFAYFSSDSPANLLLMPTFSIQMRRFQNYRYGSTGNALRGSYNDSGPTWNGRPAHLTGWVWTYDQTYGLFISKVIEFFEYTDKVARIGYCHIMRTEFTTDATLLDRAEAKVFLNDFDGAVRDLQYWNKSHRNTQELTLPVIRNFYTPNKEYFVFDFHTEEMSPSFVVTENQKPLVDCVLHFRRIERIFEGDRWFDIRRYGIELEHIVGESETRIFLAHDDPHRAIQIPSDVLGAGLTPNDRAGSTTPPSIVLQNLKQVEVDVNGSKIQK